MLMYRAKKQIIVTPTKCGTCTLQSFYRTPGTDAERDRNVDGWQFHRMRHGATLPKEVNDDRENWTVYMAVRHPVSRFKSIFQYIQGVPGGWGKMREYRHSFLEFATKFFEFRDEAGTPTYHTVNRAPFIWTNNLSENAKFLGGIINPLRQEDFASLGITSHSNVSGHRFSDKDTFGILPTELLQRIHEWALPDMEAYGYKPKPWQTQFCEMADPVRV